MNSARDDAKQQESQDPDSDSSFLNRSTDECNDPEFSIETPKETNVTQNAHISLRSQPSLPAGEIIDTASSTPGANCQRNQNATDSMTQMDPTLPSGDLIDSKNTLKSFQKHLSGERINVVTSADQPMKAHAVSNIPPTVPSGEVINSKFTLQSFNARSTNPSETPPAKISSNRNSLLDASNSDATFSQLPHPFTSDGDMNAQVENVYMAELVTDTPFWKKKIVLLLFGVIVIVVVGVIVGVCSSGKCGSNESTNSLPSVTIKPPFPPTTSPTAAPTGIEADVKGVVSDFINDITYFGQRISMNGTSAESRALKWVANITDGLLFTEDESALLELSSLRDDDVSFRVRQRYALATLWFQQADENGDFTKAWKNRTGWKDENECGWFGITCDDSGSVTRILFYNYTSKVANGFVGSIPPDIGLLTSLEYFVMKDNDIVGTIPESIGQCSEMIQFDLNGANFGGFGAVTGTLPSSIGQWTNITYFDMGYNEIAGTMPESTKNWVKIKILDIFSNQMTGSIPSFIGQWRSIIGLYLHSNKFTKTIPEEIGSLSNISEFFIENNLLTGSLPPSIGRLTSLTAFLADGNSFTGTIPPSIGNWTQIKRATFYSNNFTGAMPMEICANVQDGDILIRDCYFNCSCCTSCQ